MALNPTPIGKYPYDPSGINQKNLIADELHSVQPPADIKQASFIVPRLSPFFKEGVEVWTSPNRTGTRLVEGRDFFFTHRFVSGSEHLGKTLYGGIAFTNQAYSGNVYLRYQTIGGGFVVNDAAIAEALTRRLYQDVRFVTWDQLEGVPSAFPPNPHRHQVNDIKTLSDVSDKLSEIALSILGTSNGGGTGNVGNALTVINSHIQAHRAHTASQVGLGNVANYPMASNDDVIANRSDRYMSPSLTLYMFNRLLQDNDYNNLKMSLTNQEKINEGVSSELERLAETDTELSAQLSANSQDIASLKQENNSIKQQYTAVTNDVNNAVSSAATANALSAATMANVETMNNRFNGLFYVGNYSYSVGQHRLVLPGMTRVRVTIVGAGGGSGRYYDNDKHKLRSSDFATDGGDTVVYALGINNQPIEPIVLGFAGGGGAGEDSFPQSGRAAGGSAGKAQIANSIVSVSALLKTPPSLMDETTYPGTIGTTGDSENTSSNMIGGVGGYKLNDTGDLSAMTYGRGRGGSFKAGLGGSAARTTFIINNDTNSDFYFSIDVGRAGNSAGREPNNLDKPFESNGVAYTTLIR